MPKQSIYVAQQPWHGVGIDGLRLIRWWKASQIGRHHHVVPAKLCELAHVKRPVVRGAVKEQHELALALPDEVQLHSVAVGVTLHQTGLACARVRPDGRRSE